MKTKVWFHAQIRWAVLEEGKRGLRGWEESAYIFLSENDETAFHQALAKGQRHESYRKEGRRLVATKLAEIVSLDCYGANPSEFMLVSGGNQRATEYIPFDHIFDPEGAFRPQAFNVTQPVEVRLQSPYGLPPFPPPPAIPNFWAGHDQQEVCKNQKSRS